MLFLAGPIVGVALGGMWTVGRVMLVALSPPEKLGEFFGLFSLAGKVSAVFGPALTAVLLFVFGGGAYGYQGLHRLPRHHNGRRPLLPPPRPRRPPGTQRRRVRPEDGHHP